MNPDNVKPYGKLVHKAAEAGGVDEFCNAIERNGYLQGASDKEAEMIIYLIAIGAIAIGEGVALGHKTIKAKLEQRAVRKATAEARAIKAKEELENSMHSKAEEGDIDDEAVNNN